MHAESSTFATGLSKAEVYSQALSQAASLFEDQRNWVWCGTSRFSHDFPDTKYANSNLSNASALLYHGLLSLPKPSSAANWCGFYVVDPSKPEQLILGPFQGHVACQTIAFGRGVCGTAAEQVRTQLVPDVEKFPGHIACDSASKSEIVVPIVQHGKVSGIRFGLAE